ncbi:MAG: LysR family transcriptional regulator [Paralcaligenes sp.]
MIKVTLRQLEYFVAAARHGSTVKAAHALNVSQPSISHAIGELEALWDEKLFYRLHAQGMELSASGKLRYKQAQNVLQEVQNLDVGTAGGINGELSVGCFSTLGPMYFPDIMRRFHMAHPQVHMIMHEGNTEELLSRIERGTLDLALIYDMGLARAVRLHYMNEQAPYILLPEGHPLTRHDTLTVKDLSKDPFILINLPHSREYFLSIFSFAGVTPQIAMETGSLEMVRSLVANGYGLSILTTRPAKDYSYDGKRIVCRPLTGAFPPQKIAFASSAELKLSAAAWAFLHIAQTQFADNKAHQARIGEPVKR